MVYADSSMMHAHVYIYIYVQIYAVPVLAILHHPGAEERVLGRCAPKRDGGPWENAGIFSKGPRHGPDPRSLVGQLGWLHILYRARVHQG